MNPQRFGYPEQVAQLHLLAGLHALQRVAGQPGLLEESCLRPAELHAADADAVADSPAGVSDPRRMFGRHGNNAAPKMILCQPQIWGIV